MKGVVLAGGLGTRLGSLTKITNKHLLPIYDKPMVYYPIQTLINVGIKDIMIVTGNHHAGDFMSLLGSGDEVGLTKLEYGYQKGEGGIADALKLAENFVGNERFIVILGDNIIERNILEAVKLYEQQDSGAMIMLHHTNEPRRFGVPVFNKDNTLACIEEKPKFPKSDYAVIGIYMYDTTVFNYIRRLKPSGRGELEITDVNNFYIKNGCMNYSILDGWWVDAGNPLSLLRAGMLVEKTGANNL